MRRIQSIALVLFVLLLIACGATRPRLVAITPQPTPTSTASRPTDVPFDRARLGTVERDITYCEADGIALKLDVHYPKTMNGPAPVAVWVHGGGWTSGSKSGGEGIRDVPVLKERGYLVAAVEYRLAPDYKFPAMIEDVKCAVRFLRANAARFNLDPNRIGAWGSSAGGHLVALLGTTDTSAKLEGSGGYADQSSRVQAVVDLFGPTDLTRLYRGSGGPMSRPIFGDAADALVRASPTTYISKDDPPFLILQGDQDSTVPPSQSQLLYDQLKAAGVPATLVMVKNAGHSFVPVGGEISPTRDELTRLIADFFDRHLR